MKIQSRVWIALCLALCPTMASAGEGNGESRIAISAAQRPISIGKYNVLLGGEPGVLHAPSLNIGQLVLPMRIGITEDFEFFAGPVLQSEAPTIHEPAIGVVYRILNGPLEVGVRAAGDLALFQPTKAATAQIGVPVRYHVDRALSVDVGMHLLLGILPESSVGFMMPLAVNYNVTESLFTTVAAAVVKPSVGVDGGGSFTPASFSIGYTVADGDKPRFDVGARVGWPDLHFSDVMTVGVFGRVYFFL